MDWLLKHPSARTIFILAFALLSLSAPALAGPVCDDNPECARLGAAARELSRQGRYNDAKRVYDKAYQRWPDARLLFNLARVLHKAERLADAVTYYQRYIDAGAEGNQAQRQKAQAYLEQARSELERSRKGIDPQTPAGSAVPVASAPPITQSGDFSARLSPRRKLIAGILGGLGGAVLVASIALTATDKQYTSLPCTAMNPAGACRLDNLGLYATGYALTGALAIGVGFTLFWPARTPKTQVTP